jgi:hypothetical protein
VIAKRCCKQFIQQIGWEQISIGNITVAELYFGAYNSQKLEKFTLPENYHPIMSFNQD